MVLPEVMYGCDSWTIKKAEHWKIDAFELLRLRKLLRVLWTARRSNQSILEEISPEYSLEGLMLKLKLLYFGHLMQRTYSLLKTLMLGKIEDRRRRGWQRMRWLDGIAAATAKSLQLCLTLCDPIDGGSPSGSPVPGILQARTLEWVAISFSNAWKWKVKVKSLSHAWLLVTPWTVAYQAPPSVGFSRQEYWSGLPLPSPWMALPTG